MREHSAATVTASHPGTPDRGQGDTGAKHRHRRVDGIRCPPSISRSVVARGSGVGESQHLVRVRQHRIRESKCRALGTRPVQREESTWTGRGHGESQCHGQHGTARHPEQRAGHY